MMSDSADEQEYILGTRREELLRLGFQHQVWAPVTSALWQQAGFGPGDRLLDVGSGPGYATFDLAALAGDGGEVLAVDLSQRFVEFIRDQAAARGVANIRAEVQNVERLSVPDASVNGAFARWVLCFTSDPDAVIAGVARALRPGGRFAVLDYCHYQGLTMAPHSSAITKVIAATAESVRRSGGNMDIGQDLPGMMERHGLVVERIDPVVRLARPGSALWLWPETFFSGYLITLREMELITAGEALEFQEAWRERSSDDSSFLLTPPMVSVIAKKE
jgi:ubiquinone/menaquinone biosynthesis C-methylase UbiE